MNNAVLLIKSVLYVNNLKKNNTNTTHTAHILQMIQYIWLSNQSIWSPSTTRESQFLFANINLFFDKLSFLLVCFWWLFWLPCKELSTKHIRFFEYFLNSVLLKHVTNFEQINWTNLLLLLLGCEMDFSTELFRIKEKFITPSWATVGPQTTTDNISSYSSWLIHFCSHIAVGYIMKHISEAEFDHKCFNFAIQCK